MPIYTSKFNKIQHQTYNISDLYPLLKFNNVTLIFQRFPNVIKNNYYEMFSENGAILFKLIQALEYGKIKFINKKSSINIHDLDFNIINLYNVIKNHHHQLKLHIIDLLNQFNKLEKFCNDELEIDKIKLKSINQLKYQEEFYYFIQNQFNQETSSIKLASQLIFLTRLSKGGAYNKINNLFLVPYNNGHHISYDKRQIDSLNYYFNKYDVNFYHENIEIFSQRFVQDDFVYINSPYIPATLKFQKCKTYSHFQYDKSNNKWQKCINSKLKVYYILDLETNKMIPTDKSKAICRNYYKNNESFGINEHKQLHQLCCQLDARNVSFMLFNSNCQWIKELYQTFNQDTILIRSSKGINPIESDYDVIIRN